MGNAVSARLYGNLNYDFLRDLAPVAGIDREPLGMQVQPSSPAKSVPEFITYAKANPGKISYASAGTGISLHMAGELFKMMVGVDMVHVPYRSSTAATTDLLGGQVQMLFQPAALVDRVRSDRPDCARPRRPGRPARLGCRIVPLLSRSVAAIDSAAS